MSNDQEARKAQTITLFNALSSDYDSGAACFAHFGRRLVEVAGINFGARVLDIASGRGAVLSRLRNVLVLMVRSSALTLQMGWPKRPMRKQHGVDLAHV